jgi:EpsI family protein
MISTRISLLAVTLLTAIFATHNLKSGAAGVLQQPLQLFPYVVNGLSAQDRPYDDAVVQTIGTNEYINRVYGGETHPVELYIGYYEDPQSGDRMHSPMNCLPGSGWEPIESSQIQLEAPQGAIKVNKYLVAQGMQKALVLYWYQSHGRVVSSEYGAKFWLIADSIKHRSTGSAMVRIWTTAADGKAAETRAVAFAQKVIPQMGQFLPAD